MELLFDELVDNVQGSAAALAARIGAELVLFGFEVAGDRLAPRGPRLLLRRRLGGGLVRGLGPLLESTPGFSLDDGWGSGWRRSAGSRNFALLALRYREQLRDALGEPRELGEQLRDLRAELCILLAQRFQPVHGRVEIILGDPCRSPCVPFRIEAAGTSRAAPL